MATVWSFWSRQPPTPKITVTEETSSSSTESPVSPLELSSPILQPPVIEDVRKGSEQQRTPSPPASYSASVIAQAESTIRSLKRELDSIIFDEEFPLLQRLKTDLDFLKLRQEDTSQPTVPTPSLRKLQRAANAYKIKATCHNISIRSTRNLENAFADENCRVQAVKAILRKYRASLEAHRSDVKHLEDIMESMRSEDEPDAEGIWVSDDWIVLQSTLMNVGNVHARAESLLGRLEKVMDSLEEGTAS